MPSFKAGDIVFVPFPFEENGLTYKNRPALLLAVKEPEQCFLAAKITTTELNRYWAFHLNAGTTDCLYGRILKASWVNLNRRAWFSFSDCTRKFASLKPEILRKILGKIL